MNIKSILALPFAITISKRIIKNAKTPVEIQNKVLLKLLKQAKIRHSERIINFQKSKIIKTLKNRFL